MDIEWTLAENIKMKAFITFLSSRCSCDFVSPIRELKQFVYITGERKLSILHVSVVKAT